MHGLYPSFSASQAQTAHAIFETLAFAIGGWLWRRNRKATTKAEPGFAVAIGCIFGAGIGNKLVAWFQLPVPLWSHGQLHLPGQSMVGGLLGAWIGIEIAKHMTGIRRSTGDDFVVPLLIGLAIGRIGCFLAGLHEATYGLPTSMPWGIDLGDGIPRHPTPLYEILFAVGLAILLSRLPLPPREGLRFRLCATAYLLWRLGIEALKPAPWHWLGLSGIQWTCLVALVWSMAEIVRTLRSPRT